MAGTAPNSQNIERVAGGVANSTSVVVHPEYQYFRPEWQKLRDVISGQREIKRQGKRYLKKLPGMDEEDYDAFLDGATFYNMTGQTLNGMIGQVFRRDPILLNLPQKFKDAIRAKFAKDGTGINGFIKTVISEQIGMGRFGVLVDAQATPSTTPTSFAVGYAAENILDWTVEEVNGEYRLTRVLLREFSREQYSAATQNNPWIGAPNKRVADQRSVRNATKVSTSLASQKTVRSANYIEAYTYTTVYRELCLERGDDGTYKYVQYTYDEDPNGVPNGSYVPSIRGKTLDFIPFQFFGASQNTADVEKSPLIDIADLNISHYRSYALLEHGRAYTALPVYYAPGKEDESAAAYRIGPSMVWEVPEGQPPGLLEYTGQGLKALETALATKEGQIAAIGGRMMPGSGKGSESPNQTMLRESSEQALLLNVIQCAEFGISWVIRWWLMWRDVPLTQSEPVQCTVNRDFVSSDVGAREMRALQQLHEAGKAPIEVIYNALIAAEWLDAETTLEDYIDSLNDPQNFPNAPDIIARQRGFQSRQQELDQTQVAREADMQQQEIDLQEREVEIMENAPPLLPPKAPSPSGAALPARPGGPVAKKPGRAMPKKAK